jgi:gluconolactonase
MIFTNDLSLPVSPVQLPDSSWLVSEMGPDRGWVSHISADGGTKRVVAKTGQPNGLLMDKDGTIWVANSNPPALLRLTMNGQVVESMTQCAGEPLLFPNDLVFGPDGALYLTDSGVLASDLLSDDMKTRKTLNVRPDGRIFRIDLKTGKQQKLDSGIGFANGMAFDPSRNLYITETLTGDVYRYQWRAGQVSEVREDFINALDPDGMKVGPLGPPGCDGIKVDTKGFCYIAVLGQQHICVVAPDGTIHKRIQTKGRVPTNLAFGPPESRKLYISETEFGVIEIHDTDSEAFAFTQA